MYALWKWLAKAPQDGDETAIYDSAQALVTLQKLYGLFPRVVGKGDFASVGRHFCGYVTRPIRNVLASDLLVNSPSFYRQR
jgi:vacuolar protein sorting-associated protein 33A